MFGDFVYDGASDAELNACTTEVQDFARKRRVAHVRDIEERNKAAILEGPSDVGVLGVALFSSDNIELFHSLMPEFYDLVRLCLRNDDYRFQPAFGLLRNRGFPVLEAVYEVDPSRGTIKPMRPIPEVAPSETVLDAPVSVERDRERTEHSHIVVLLTEEDKVHHVHIAVLVKSKTARQDMYTITEIRQRVMRNEAWNYDEVVTELRKKGYACVSYAELPEGTDVMDCVGAHINTYEAPAQKAQVNPDADLAARIEDVVQRVLRAEGALLEINGWKALPEVNGWKIARKLDVVSAHGATFVRDFDSVRKAVCFCLGNSASGRGNNVK